VSTFLYYLRFILLIVVSIKVERRVEEVGKRRTTRFKKSSNCATSDSVVRWDVAEKVERSGEWMI
jgi:hypothetical protein